MLQSLLRRVLPAYFTPPPLKFDLVVGAVIEPLERRRLMDPKVWCDPGGEMTEGNQVVFWVNSQNIMSPTTVNVDFTGSATQDIDYTAALLDGTPVTDSIRFNGLDDVVEIYVTGLHDDQIESDEAIVFELLPGDGYTVEIPQGYPTVPGQQADEQTTTILAQTYQSLEYGDIQANGASNVKRKEIAAGTTENFDSIKIIDSTGSVVAGTLSAEAKPAGGGAAVPGISVVFEQLGTGPYRAKITVGTVPAGDYNIKITLQDDPTKTIFLYIKV